jgi:hypothetical protein
MVLLVADGLLLRSLVLVTSVNPGFDPKNVIEAEVSLPQCQYSAPQQWTAFSNELLARLHAQPGLQDSALAAPLRIDRQGLFMEGRSLSSVAAGIRHAVDSCLKALASRREKMYRLAAEIHQIGRFA